MTADNVKKSNQLLLRTAQESEEHLIIANAAIATPESVNKRLNLLGFQVSSKMTAGTPPGMPVEMLDMSNVQEMMNNLEKM